MLSAQLGIRLVLLAGDTLPLPLPYALTSQLQKVEVTMDAAGRDGFQLVFKLARDAVVDSSILLQGTLDPFKRVVVAVMFGILPEVLIDGVVTNQQYTPGGESTGSTLTVTGKDISQMLDLEEKNEEFPNQPDFVIATRIIGQYAQYGLIPMPTPTTDVPIFLQRIPRQAGTDLATLQRLAARNGYVFYVEPLTVGTSTAYWGPENRLSAPQPPLTMNMGPADNVKGLHFTHDGLAPVGTRGSFVEPITGMVLPIPPLPSLKVPPLALRPTTPRRIRLTRDTAQANPAQAATAALSAATNAPDAVRGEGELDSARYGHALRARKLVGVRGVGITYDGYYYVSKVTHTVEQGKYSQRFTLTREGVLSSVPAVPGA